jgi:multiple sugar transport system substrate-binding protein
MRTFRRSRGAAIAAAVATAGLLVTACGGSTASTAPTQAPVTQAPVTQAPATQPPASGESAATPAAGYTGPDVTITYSIWGDPAELKSQQAIVDKFHAANPNITVKVEVSDWDPYFDKLQTGLAGGAAPDVFAMDGPLFPDYQSRGVLLDLKPFIDRDGYDLTQLADQGVAVFTTADGGQYGIPRDLNTIVMYYNKTMFDAAGIAYPDDTWDWAKLVEVSKKLTLDVNGDKTVDQWGFYTETTDMENYWSSLVWQAGGDIMNADKTKTLLGTPEAATGVQFLQDLIWKEKVMPEPAMFAELGDAFEQGKAAMEANGSWLVPTHTAAGADLGFEFGIAPLPKGPAGRFTSVNPTGAVVYKGTKAPDAAWEFVKYLASPVAQEQLMQLHASLPVSKEVLAGPYSTAFPGSDVLAASLAYANLKPSFAGYNEFNTMLQGELDVNVFNEPKKTAAQALADIVPQLDAFLASR